MFKREYPEYASVYNEHGEYLGTVQNVKITSRDIIVPCGVNGENLFRKTRMDSFQQGQLIAIMDRELVILEVLATSGEGIVLIDRNNNIFPYLKDELFKKKPFIVGYVEIIGGWFSKGKVWKYGDKPK